MAFFTYHGALAGMRNISINGPTMREGSDNPSHYEQMLYHIATSHSVVVHPKRVVFITETFQPIVFSHHHTDTKFPRQHCMLQ